MSLQELIASTAEWKAGGGREETTRVPLRLLLPCEFEGPVVEACKSCGGGEARHVRLCFHPAGERDRCTRVRVGPAVRACADCPDRRPVGPVAINMGAGGIGDGLLGLLAVAAYKAANPGAAVEYRVGPAAVPFVRLFGGYDSLGAHKWDRGGSVPPAGDAVELNAGYRTERSSNRWDRYAKNAGVAAVLRPPPRDPLPASPHPGAVVIAPFSNYREREVPAEVWAAVEARLDAAGVPTVVVGAANEEGRARGFGGPAAFGWPPEKVAALFAGSRCVAGNDSGPAHLAGVLGVRGVVAATPDTGARVYGGYGCVRCVERRTPADVRATVVVAAVLGGA